MISELKNPSLEDAVAKDPGPPFWQPQEQEVLRQRVAGRQHTSRRHEWIEMGVRSQELVGSNTEEDETIFSHGDPRARDQRARSVPNVAISAANRLHRGAQHSLIPGGYPDVDYPTDPHPGEADQNGFARGATLTSSSSTIRSSTSGGDPETFSSNPRLRRQRPLASHHGPSGPTQKPVPRGSDPTWSASSNSDSDSNSRKTPISDARKVLKLGSLKSNQGMFWNMFESREREEPQIFSDTELPHVKNTKRPKLKPQRRLSIPSVTPQEVAPPPRLPQVKPARNLNGTSPLEGLLERAKARKGEMLRRDRAATPARPAPSPSFSTTPSPSASDVDRDTEWEDPVQVTRRPALSVSKGWREQLVDGDDDEDERNSLLYSNGVNVDWSGWCFDDDEVMDQLQPSGQGLLEGITQSLPFWDLHYGSEHEEGEYSQV